MTKENLKTLASTRLEEAKVLYDNKLYEGCNYLLGYVIELAFKARICTLLKLDSYPEKIIEYKRHDYENLLLLSGLSTELDEKIKNDSNFGIYWSNVKNWDVIYRYKKTLEYNKNSDNEVFSRTQYDCTVFIFNWIQEKW